MSKNKNYDFIIVGGGTSGIITATKLIKSGASVLIIEEGNRSNSLLLSMPAGWIKGLDGSPHLRFYKSIPQKQLNERQHDIAQAKTLGGGSKVNGMVYMRGKPSDYNRWEESTGDNNWNWNSIIKNFIKLENNERIEDQFHGNFGSLKVSDPGYVAEGSNIYIKTMQELGLPYNSDFNDGNQYGVGLMQFTIGDGKRCDVVKAFLKSVESNTNLDIQLNTVVTKVILENKKAIGVESISRGNEKIFNGNEIILTAGALVTPKILMHSGIGEEQHLKKFNIKVFENLKGVGKNLQDHHEVPVISKTKPGYGYFNEDKGLRMIKNGLQYLLFKSGPVRSIGVDCCSFLNPENFELLLSELENIDEIGPTIAKSITQFWESNANKTMVHNCLKSGLKLKKNRVKINNQFSNKIFVFTGTLEKMSRQRARILVEKFGGKITNSVSKNTTYVVAGPGAGSKLNKAKQIGIEVISEREFLTLIN